MMMCTASFMAMGTQSKNFLVFFNMDACGMNLLLCKKFRSDWWPASMNLRFRQANFSPELATDARCSK